jgi:hypothetical protein
MWRSEMAKSQVTEVVMQLLNVCRKTSLKNCRTSVAKWQRASHCRNKGSREDNWLQSEIWRYGCDAVEFGRKPTFLEKYRLHLHVRWVSQTSCKQRLYLYDLLVEPEDYYIIITHGAEPFLRSRQLCSHPRTFQRFKEPEGSIPCSQEPSTGPYPEPHQSNPNHPILSL